MPLTRISLQDIRSFELFASDLDPKLTLILGQNGAGKTSLLEAIYFMQRGTSFRGRDRDMIRHEIERGEIKLEQSDGSVRRGSLTLTSNGKVAKSFQIGDKASARLGVKDRRPVVLFEPDELRLLSSSPQRRRDFFDGTIARLSPTYSTVLSRFARTLLQRNELLKQYDTMSHGAWESHLFAWDVKFAELAATIIKARRNFIQHSNKRLGRIYSELAGQKHDVIATYSSSEHALDTLQQTLLHKLEHAHQSDALQGYTSVGPHRDDVLVSLDDYPAAETASRGEMRTIMLAYKLLEVELQQELSGESPLILMDDVFSELDISREKQLMQALSNHQTIITATDLRDELKINASVVSL